MLGKCKAATEALCVPREIEGETTKDTSGLWGYQVSKYKYRIKVSK